MIQQSAATDNHFALEFALLNRDTCNAGIGTFVFRARSRHAPLRDQLTDGERGGQCFRARGAQGALGYAAM